MRLIGAALAAATTILNVGCGRTPPSQNSTHPRSAEVDVAALSADSGLVLLRDDRVDVVFPISPIGPGCARPKDLQGPTTPFRWTISYLEPTEPRIIELRRNPEKRTLAESLMQRALVMWTGIDVSLPTPPPVTEARLDSAFARRAVGIWTGTWVRDGAGATSLTEPELRAVYFDHTRLHFVIKGPKAIAAFLSLRPDSVKLTWCGPTGYDRQLTVAVTRG